MPSKYTQSHLYKSFPILTFAVHLKWMRLNSFSYSEYPHFTPFAPNLFYNLFHTMSFSESEPKPKGLFPSSLLVTMIPKNSNEEKEKCSRKEGETEQDSEWRPLF